MKKIIFIISVIGLVSIAGFLITHNNLFKTSGKNNTEVNNSDSSKLDSNISPSPSGTEKPAVTPEATQAATPTAAPVLTQVPTVTPELTPKPTEAPMQSQTPSNNEKGTSKNKVIVIDPGHANHSNLEEEANAPGSTVMKIKDGGGTQGVVTKTPEYLVNMDISLKLRDLLQQKGYTVIMTKTDNSVSLGNIDRAKVGNDANASLVVRVHANGSDNQSTKGALMMVPSASSKCTKNIYSESYRCGKIVLDTLIQEVGMKSCGVQQYSDMTGFNWSKVPVIIIETGFMSNAGEDKLLSSSDYQSKIAKGLADGVALAVK